MQIGRVESDPMGVPVATALQRSEDRFDRVLREASERDAEPVPAADEAADPATTTDEQIETPATDDSDIERDPREPVADDGDRDAPSTDRATTGDANVADADVTDSTRRGEPERQNASAGKGADSPRAFHSPAEPLLAATLQAQPVQPTGAPVGQAAAQKVASANGGEPLIRATGRSEASGGAPEKTARAQAGYATRSAAQAQLLEQARDSVFKQILMKLTDDGGHVRMRLEPPDLGELDLRMTVEGGNKLSLAIAAERSDLAQLLQRHLDELKQALQQNGLEITGAEVQSRDDFERGGEHGGTAGDHATDGDAADEREPGQKPQGYITAEGLDYWV